MLRFKVMAQPFLPTM